MDVNKKFLELLKHTLMQVLCYRNSNYNPNGNPLLI